MEIILKENVANVGFKDEVVTVKAGYGRNFLIPNGKAVLATESAKKVLAENLKQKAFKEKSIIDDAEKLATKISKLELKISAKVGPDGKLFGSISNADVAKGLSGKKIEIEKENIWDFIDKIYLPYSVHYSKFGNQIIADTIKKNLK